MVVAPCVPRATVRLDGDAESEKSPAGLTVRAIWVCFVKLPEVPIELPS
jgi:hypothetical protein